MPIHRLNPIISVIPRLNIDYFDRKALENQKRRDAAVTEWQKDATAIANNPFLDQAAREQFLKEREAMFEDAVVKNSGNLSKGYADVIEAVNQSKLHPYHNLSKRLYEENKKRQELAAKYGAEFIDQSKGLNQPLYKDGKWIDPGSIEAMGMKADDYGKVVEETLSDVAAQITSGIRPAGMDPSGYYYLYEKYKNKTLTPEMLIDMAQNPYVQQAIKSNAPTSAFDTRQYNNGMTYQEMFNNPEEFGKFIYGNIQDKQRNDRVRDYQFVKNEAKFLADKYALEDYKYRQQNYVSDPDLTVITGTQKVDAESYNDIKDKANSTKQSYDGLTTKYDNQQKTIASNLGLQNSDDIYQFVDDTENVDKNKLTEHISNLYAEELQNMNKDEAEQFITNQVNSFETSFKHMQETRKQLYQTEKELELYSGVKEDIDKSIYNDLYNEIPKEEKEILNVLGINSPEKLANLDKGSETGILKGILGNDKIINFNELSTEQRKKLEEMFPPYKQNSTIGVIEVSTEDQVNGKLSQYFGLELEQKVKDKLNQGIDIGEEGKKYLSTTVHNPNEKAAVSQMMGGMNKAFNSEIKNGNLESLNGFMDVNSGLPLAEKIGDELTNVKEINIAANGVSTPGMYTIDVFGEDSNKNKTLIGTYQVKSNNNVDYANSYLKKSIANTFNSTKLHGRKKQEDLNRRIAWYGKNNFEDDVYNVMAAASTNPNKKKVLTIPVNGKESYVSVTKNLGQNGEIAYRVGYKDKSGKIQEKIFKSKKDAENYLYLLSGNTLLNNDPEFNNIDLNYVYGGVDKATSIYK